ncbi:hypothetical protein HTS88_12215 [Pseudarthrobacter oxydans]|uniref:hypothetical protein n=1 Tax=Pseudarthrobacter oxydans TaxID=1671 RepID=UPI001574B394|nr:hypothetical protein [Pseudarthrobacter oxydans]NSX37163.1 hypothetical protein [Pseudarthrobacter oxydans]
MLDDFRMSVLGELPRFRWGRFQQAVREEDYLGALDIAAQALDEEAQRYRMTTRASGPHVVAPDRVALYLASIFGRLDVIDRVIAIEQFALEAARQPYRPQFGDKPDNDLDTVLESHHRRNADAAPVVHGERLAMAIQHKEDHSRFTAILEAVRNRPGILQVDLAGVIPDRDTKSVTRMVDQLESTGLVATKKVGSRVAVWPAEHSDAPSEAERRTPRWYWAVDDYWEDRPYEWEDPARTTADIEALADFVEEAARQPGIDEGLRPTPLDFLQGRTWHFVSPALSGGYPVHADPEQLALAFWGHRDLEEAAAMAERIIHSGGADTTPNQKKKWLLARPRHTHVERIPFTERFRKDQGWLLREVPEPTPNSVPATAFTASGVCTDPDKAAELGVACWLKQRKTR